MMAPSSWRVTWEDGMSVGIPEIDEDHQRFIALVDKFNNSVANRTALIEIEKSLQDILDDVVRHFAHEERLLDEWHYPDADQHARVHAQLLKVLQDIQSTISTGYAAEWAEAGFKIKNALISHFQTEDMKYAEYYQNSRGAASV